jgi:DNA topoisomerase-6 subunit B
VPYTSESKEAIAHYPEILRELKLALQEAGRRLAIHVRRRRREADEDKKQRYIHKYIDPIGEALQEILGLSAAQTQVAVETIREILEKSRKF